MSATTTPEQEAFMMVGFLASELEAAINSMEEMIVYVSDYFRHKWNLDADIVRARDALRSYQAFRDRQDTLPSEAPSEAPTGLPEALESLDAVRTAMKQNGLA